MFRLKITSLHIQMNATQYAGRKAIFLFWLSLLFLATSFANDSKKAEFAGSFYPADKKALDDMLSSFLAEAKIPVTKGRIIGIVSPHAGYIYSGPTAAYGYRVLEKTPFDAIILLAPSHNYGFNGVSIYPKGYFQSPLGNLEIDAELASEFKEIASVQFEPKYFENEHSLEVQLPFIIKTTTSPKIVPLLFGQLRPGDIEEVVKKIEDISSRKKILVIASTDLSHYHPYKQAQDIDADTIRFIKNEDYISLLKATANGEGRACGIYPLCVFIAYAKAKNAQIQILNYNNSGDTAGDKNTVVGYVSALAFIPDEATPDESNMHNKTQAGQKEVMMVGFALTNEEKQTLLKIARITLENYLKDSKSLKQKALAGSLKEKRGAFVTLTKNGQLRGCIGRIVADKPLYEVVSEMAIEAATGDPRFAPVSYDELKDIHIEISVITPFEKVKNIDEIEVGKHGLMIQKGYYSGLLLPQVPGEYGWDRETFLKHTCLKAGLPPDSYKEPTATLYKFSALVFNEKEFSKE
ncbi:MAG: AmmeMemoRadiSam system protein B [Candidatus Omnitrophica bacterium]|nr:AmmeMemoRadiSam system protein B [Candidatus Omnitrophota bacterium]